MSRDAPGSARPASVFASASPRVPAGARGGAGGQGGDAFIRPRTVPAPELRLVVVPHAGGSGSVYHPLHRVLPTDWDLLLLDLPGRGKRHAQASVTDMASLVELVTEDVSALDDGTPLALFGHSLGAVIASETARSLRTRGIAPVWVGVSGRQATSIQPAIRLLDPSLSDTELARRLARLGGLPDRIDELPEFRDRFLRLIRSDLHALDSYRPDPDREPLSADLTVFASTDDALAPVPGVSAWSRETSGDFRRRLFQGGHFHFLGETFPDFAEALAAEITHTLARLTPSGTEAATPHRRETPA
ncbi:thioesterase II family protein [Streptomyces profundus]|uniref:thioesterase II family protein n=1 Tax=Streptomyces profundus TaxID=2867410 RepID=UPI001D169544|nr:alpha/beta fold hydrolase [Streptomyces sp. MA3_2.13]UED88046.1 alpha/beta fold hydrolase [Streptomyces sp. MA3_2.13]